MKISSLILLALFSAFPVGSLMATDAPATEEDRLRSALRDSTIQLRTAQSDLANLQSTDAALAAEKAAVSDKLEALKKQMITERISADKSASILATQLAEQKQVAAKLKGDLEKAEAVGAKASEADRTAEAQIARLKSEKIFLERKVADLESKNLSLFLTGNEILSRYAEFSLGNALSAKEPFVSLTRTKLENLVQDYQDKLLDERATQ
jgi:chromosome segregation ATPase